ncbi:MAG: hypothetical protein V3T90_02705 [Anaerolineae bacterium]
MAPLVTHLVIGERVFAQSPQFASTDYVPFLLGCVLVDANNFSGMDRRRTHFVGRLEDDGADAFNRSCANFLSQFDDLLVRPWSELTGAEQTFIGGYLCHLAADEVWKQFSWNMLRALEIQSLAALPVPGGVIFTAFGVLSSKMYIDFPAVVSALNDVAISHVMTHVPYDAFQAMWEIVKEYMLTGGTPGSYFEMLKREGRTDAEVREIIRRHDVYWEDAVALIHDLGSVEPFIQAAIRRSLEMIPRLWA